MSEQQGSAAGIKVLVAVLNTGQINTRLSTFLLQVIATERRFPIMVKHFGGDAAAVPHSSNRNRIMRDTPPDFSGVLMFDSDTVPHRYSMDIPLLGKDVVLAPCPIWRPTDHRGPIITNLVPLGLDGGNSDDSVTLKVGSNNVQKIKEGGAGCLYLSRAVLDHPGMRGAFAFETDEWGVTTVGEDHHFCRVAAENGFDVHGALAYPQGHMKTIDLSTAFDAYHPLVGRKPRLIIVGPGRSGTGYAKTRFDALGLPIGHEGIFMYSGLEAAKTRMSRFTNIIGDSSWMAAPYLDDPFLDKAIVIHQTRNPGKVIASWIRKPTRETTRYWKFVLEHIPWLEDIEDPATQGAARYVLWNRMIEQKAKTAYRWRIEDKGTGERKMLEWLHSIGAIDDAALTRINLPNRATNRHGSGEPQMVYLDQIQEPWRTEIEAMANDYGYEDWTEMHGYASNNSTAKASFF